jgi:nicotinamide-nucleotide amidase
MTTTEALAGSLGAALTRRSWRAVTAESCTGGLVAGAITDIAGSSAWFERGFVTYSNEAKESVLGVPDVLIAEHGAVSEATARAMVQGALAASLGDIAVSVTGVAGPGGGTEAKPVGMVCFAWGTRASQPVAVTRHFAGDRAQVRRASVEAALEGLLALASNGMPAGAR